MGTGLQNTRNMKKRQKISLPETQKTAWKKSYDHFCRVWKIKNKETWQQRSTASGKKPTGLYFRALLSMFQ